VRTRNRRAGAAASPWRKWNALPISRNLRPDPRGLAAMLVDDIDDHDLAPLPTTLDEVLPGVVAARSAPRLGDEE